MYICRDCGKTFEDYEVEETIEFPYGEKHCGLGAPWISLKRIVVEEECSCGGEISKAKTCDKCGQWCPQDRNYCLDCLETHKTFETMLEIGSEWEEKLSINGFLYSAFTKDEIELILIDAFNNLTNEKREKAINKYCDDDIEYFWGVAEKKCREKK